jgi:hypothetical protein
MTWSTEPATDQDISRGYLSPLSPETMIVSTLAKGQQVMEASGILSLRQKWSKKTGDPSATIVTRTAPDGSTATGRSTAPYAHSSIVFAYCDLLRKERGIRRAHCKH